MNTPPLRTDPTRFSRAAITFLALVLAPIWLLTYAAVAQGPVTSPGSMVVSASTLATRVGVETIKRGGNAVDAAVAAAFALAVVHPSAGNIGGGGFMLYRSPGGAVTAIDFREKAPLAATEAMFLDGEGSLVPGSNHTTGLSVGVPGTVAGLYLAHSRYGSLPWKGLIGPAIALARDGVSVSQSLHDEMKRYTGRFSTYPATARKMLVDGTHPYVPGAVWKQPDLMRALRLIQSHGPGGFYRGYVGRKIVETVRKHGGVMTIGDLRGYKAVERPPVHGTYRGYHVYSMPLPSSGGTTLIEMLNILEGFDLSALGHNTAPYLHILTEAMRLAYLDRARHLGDPDHNPGIPLARLLSKEYASMLTDGIDHGKAGKSATADVIPATEGTDTTHISVVDAAGGAVSLTYTLEQAYGSMIVVDGAGFFLNNEMGDFNPVPGHTDDRGLIGTVPNRVAPGKRMLSSMTPAIVTRDGGLLLVLGSPGGRTIINTVLQVILNVVDHGMDIARATSAGRIHHQWLPDITRVEGLAATPATLERYEGMGHRTEPGRAQGKVMAIHRDAASGVLTGMPDPRSPGGLALGF